MKKKSRIGLNIGTSSILLVFVLLCMVTFAALSFVSANADYKLSRSLETRTTQYYTVSNDAERRLSEIEDVLAEVKGQAADFGEYKALVQEILETGTGTGSGGDLIRAEVSYKKSDESWAALCWQLPFSDTQALDIIINLTDPFENDSYFTVSSWKVISTVLWEDNSTLELFDGQ